VIFVGALISATLAGIVYALFFVWPKWQENQAVEALGQAIRARDFAEMSAAIERLNEMHAGAAAIDPLTEAMYDEDSEVVGMAIDALRLVSAGPEMLVPALLKAIDKSGNWATIWSDLGDKAIPPLIKALNDRRNAATRANAARSLSYLGCDIGPAVPSLADALKDVAASVRDASARSLGEIGAQAVPAIPSLIIALNEDDERLYTKEAGPALRSVVKSLTKIDAYETAIPNLIEGMRHKSASIRWGVIRYGVLDIESDDESLVDALTVALTDVNEDVRRLAAYGLGKYGPKSMSAVAALRSAMNRRETRAAAIISLRTIDPRSVPDAAIVEALQDKTAYYQTRERAIQLVRTCEPEAQRDAIPTLIELLREHYFGSFAEGVLVEMGAQAVPALVGSLKNWTVKHEAMKVLRKMGAHAGAAVPALIEAMDDIMLVDEAIAALDEIGPSAQQCPSNDQFDL
jgi:HEAT repeat protein